MNMRAYTEPMTSTCLGKLYRTYHTFVFRACEAAHIMKISEDECAKYSAHMKIFRGLSACEVVSWPNALRYYRGQQGANTPSI